MQLICVENDPAWKELRSISPEPETIILTREAVPRLQELLLRDENVTDHMIHLCISTGGGLLKVHSGAEVLLAGYHLYFDGTWHWALLSLSKRIDLETMIRASKEYDFDFE